MIQPDQAAFLLKMYTNEIEMEMATTRKVLAAVPADKGDYSPDPVSRKALDLAWHIAASEVWFLDSLAAGQFGPEGAMPETIKSSADVVAYYNSSFGPALAKVKALSGEQLAKPLDFFGAFNLPGIMYLSFLVRHSVHHRGQLAAYLRPMGGKVPSIYGGSADEPWQAESAGA